MRYLVFLFGFLLMWFTPVYESPDLANQYHAAQTLLSGHELTRPNGNPMHSWPPLLTLTLAALRWVAGNAAMDVWYLLNAIFYGLIGALLCRFMRPPLVIALLLLPPMRHVFAIAVSEGMFNLLLLLWFIRLQHGVGRLSQAYQLALIVMMACLGRYTGVLLIPFSLLALPRRYWLLFGSIATYPLALWCVRNIYLVGAPFGVRPSSPYTLTQTAMQATVELLNWLPFFLGFLLIDYGLTLWQQKSGFSWSRWRIWS